jgi:hypothetical protein
MTFVEISKRRVGEPDSQLFRVKTVCSWFGSTRDRITLATM